MDAPQIGQQPTWLSSRQNEASPDNLVLNTAQLISKSLHASFHNPRNALSKIQSLKMQNTTPFRPTMHRFAAATAPSTVRLPIASRAPNLIIPSLVIIGAVSGVVAYIRSQLAKESATMNKMFAQQNTPQVIEARNRNLLVATEGDPRKTIYNVLNW
ncbi:hypothetical protein B0H63DRAFT_167594 [Podospora didyma]|uniref:Uncharacterized protein n=1 Tax=Podospora didyma TaxID=330526 RepID=A0AAE0U204_9PEZI|nr:hypothetical protein B0H63DRAFT_167594 [Podospora didyma]